jgi:hypothetical protein
MRGRISVRSASFYRQIVQRSANLSCKRECHASYSPPVYRNSTLSSLSSSIYFRCLQMAVCGEGGRG